MARSNRPKSSERVIGKGEVTPIQVAFLVDRYLCDNRFSKTRAVFRSEASSLISNSPVREVPNSLIPLDEILNEYIRLKKKKMVTDQEKVKVDQEKTRVQNLLNGMQNVMNAYNSAAAGPPPPAISTAAPTIPTTAPIDIQAIASTSQQNNFGVSPSGCSAYKTPNTMAVSLPGNKRVGNFTTPSISQSVTNKRKTSEVSLGSTSVARKGMKKMPQADKVNNYLTFQTPSETQTSMNNRAADDSSNLAPSVAKCLFNNKSDMSPPTISACMGTPQRQVSNQGDKFTTLQQEVTPTECTIVTTERIKVSPLKQIASYTLERSHTVSSFSPVKSSMKMSSKRDHVKGRLNFDDAEAAIHLDAPSTVDPVSSSPSGSEPDSDDLLDIDFSSIDLLNVNLSFSEFLGDFDLGCEGMSDPFLPQSSNLQIETDTGYIFLLKLDTSEKVPIICYQLLIICHSVWSSPESMNANSMSDQFITEYTSTATKMIQEKEMNTQGSDSTSTVKSITKSVRILSPAKNCR